jgi:lysophospholipase L1-like esterase
MRIVRLAMATLVLLLVTGAQRVLAQAPLAASTQPANTALVPLPKIENDSYDWYARHAAVLEARDHINPEIVLIGDSITHFWSGEPTASIRNGPEAWKQAFGGRRVLNLGFGWDRTQNVLWRLEHGEFDGLHPHYVILNIGTNNFSTTKNAQTNTPAQVAEAIGIICDRIHAQSPQSRIILMGVFPRGQKADDSYRTKITQLNSLLSAQAKKSGFAFLDLGPQMLQPDGSISRQIMGDFCHPTEKGYAIWAEALKGVIKDQDR